MFAITEIISQAYSAVSKAEALFGKKSEWQGRTGGFLCVADSASGLPYVMALIGSVPTEKFQKCFSFCQEKAVRLAAHPTDLSSWESRDSSNGRYGGAIRVQDRIFSFSGAPELGDEAMMLAAACGCYRLGYHVGGPDLDLFNRIAARSGNPY